MVQLLITGGAGFIGSHACLTFLEAGNSLVVIDNYSNSSELSLNRVAELTQFKDTDQFKIIEGDIGNKDDLEKVFKSAPNPIEAVIHFAGLKAVSESLQNPLKYWDVNLNGSCCLIDAMRSHNCRTIVFSSSATIYGYPKNIPITEKSPIYPINPYGHTKAAVEQLLTDVGLSEEGWRIACLRYFNPVGAHQSGLIGEDPNGVPNNLFPFVSQVAIGRLSELEVFGSNWPTPDGSAIRDYIHVMDLVEGHLAALNCLLDNDPQFLTCNLGSGKGFSVLEIIKAFEVISGKEIPFKIAPRRPGDVACSVADIKKAQRILGWEPKRDLHNMCQDAWHWQQLNPSGYLGK
tara:strand:- start:848 stop:1888 length:1041 start_codon:yes stop_codon:yes gene_type:complete